MSDPLPGAVPLRGCDSNHLRSAIRFALIEIANEKAFLGPYLPLVERILRQALTSSDHLLCCACGGSGVQHSQESETKFYTGDSCGQ